MPFTYCTLGGKTLPLNFEWEPDGKKRRMEVLETYYADVTQIRPYYEGDTYFSFSCKMVTDTLKSDLETLFEADNTITFKDYEGRQYTVFLCEFHYKQRKGMWDITGKIKVIPT
jgi:hypothetical protein